MERKCEDALAPELFGEGGGEEDVGGFGLRVCGPGVVFGAVLISTC